MWQCGNTVGFPKENPSFPTLISHTSLSVLGVSHNTVLHRSSREIEETNVTVQKRSLCFLGSEWSHPKGSLPGTLAQESIAISPEY